MNPQFCTVVGVNFRGRDAISTVKRMSPGCLVELEAEPDNAYDSNAVRAIYEGQFIGYLAKENNTAVAVALAAGEELIGEVVSFESTIKPVVQITNVE